MEVLGSHDAKHALQGGHRRSVVISMVSIVGRAANETKLSVVIHLAWIESDTAINLLDPSRFTVAVASVDRHESAVFCQRNGAGTDERLQFLTKTALVTAPEMGCLTQHDLGQLFLGADRGIVLGADITRL